MTVKFVGKDDTTVDTGAAPNYLMACKFMAEASGSVSEFQFRSGVTGNVKFALCSDSSGPSIVLAKQDTGQAVAIGWNIKSLEAPANVVQGVAYWLVFIGDSGAPGYDYVSTGAFYKYVAKTYAGYTFPATLSESWTDNTEYMAIVAGWGDSIQILIPSSISQPVGYGSPKINLSIKPSSIVQAIAYGTPIVAIAALIIYPTSIVQSIGIGTPTLRYPQTLSPPGIIVSIAYGTPSVGTYGILRPQSIIQPVVIGTPTILKYVWHVILDGQYATETPRINRTYIIGKDQYGNPVYGSAIESSEVDLVGERLDFQQEIAIPTESQAASMATAILGKMRLTKARGVILIPPNCGQELFDVVQISDSGANQSAATFRVVGIRFEYAPKLARFEHRLILGAP